MKASNARRAKILVEALEDLPIFEKTLDRTEPESGYLERLVEIAAIDETPDVGGSPDHRVCIDIVTARMLPALLRELIVKELTAMGVDIDD